MTAPTNAAYSRQSNPLVAVAGVVMAIGCVYLTALGSGFVGDDFMILHRLRALTGPADVFHFFRGEFFGYYRPLAFVSQAIDWAVAGADARQFHLTNVLFHALSAVFVLLIGRALAPRSAAGPLAALLFALHASNHEAVVWVSARFDLLATCLSLAAIWVMVRNARGASVISAVLFLGAVLSKESAVALPIAAAAFSVFVRHEDRRATAFRLVPWLAAMGIYGVLRHSGGGVSAIGGAARLPKLMALLSLLCLLWLLAGERWVRIRTWLTAHRSAVMTAMALCIGLLALAAAAGGRAGRLAAEKLAVAGFAIFHLVSPVLDFSGMPFYLDPQRTMYWLGGVMALIAAGGVVAWLWRPLLEDERVWFLSAFFVAAMLPISALTEGARYLYLPSAAFALVAGVVVAEWRGRGRRFAMGLMLVVLLVSAVQIGVKIRDWTWAGRMTANGAQLVDAALAPSCGDGHVVMLTAPVSVRGVYTHFYYETFEPPRGCIPGSFQVLARVVRLDATVDVQWDGPNRIVITVPGYRGNVVLSEDLRHFDRPLRQGEAIRMQTAIGELRTDSADGAERLTLTLAPDVDPARTHFFYYSDSWIRPLTSVASRYNSPK